LLNNHESRGKFTVSIYDDHFPRADAGAHAGGGGTSFVPLFEHLRFSPTKTLIVFTDTWGTMPEFVPEFPVVWAVYQKAGEDVSSRMIPFGEIVAVPEHKLTR